MVQNVGLQMGQLKRNPEWDRILSASQRNDATEIERLVNEEGVNPDHSNAVGQSAVHIACIWGNVEALIKLINLGASVAIKNNITGATPLHCALQSSKEPASKRAECAKLLVHTSKNQNKDLIQCTDNYGATAFDYLIDDDYMGVQDEEFISSLKELLEVDTQQSEIFTMIRNLDSEAVQNYFFGMENIDEKELEEREGKSGLTPLLVAVEILIELCKSEGNENESVKTFQIVQILIQHGYDPCAKPQIKVPASKRHLEHIMKEDNSDSLHETSLYKVCSTLSGKYLSKEDKNLPNKTTKITILEDTALLLVNNGAEICPPINNHLLHDCARRGNLQMVRFLIELMRIDPNTSGRQGMTPLHFACRSGHTNIVEWLIQYKPNEPDENTTVDLQRKDDRGKTALDAAKANDKQDVIALLTKITK